MKKIVTTFAVTTGFTVSVGLSGLSSVYAATQKPTDVSGGFSASAAATPKIVKPALKAKCENDMKKVKDFSSTLVTYQKYYYQTPSIQDLDAYYTVKKDTKMLDGSTASVHSAVGTFPATDKNGTVIPNKSVKRVNYASVLHSHEGSLAVMTALGKGIDKQPAYTAYASSIDSLRGSVADANAFIQTQESSWNSPNSLKIIAAVDCNTSDGVMEAKTLTKAQATDFKKNDTLRKAKGGVDSKSKIVARNFLKARVTYNNLKKAKA